MGDSKNHRFCDATAVSTSPIQTFHSLITKAPIAASDGGLQLRRQCIELGAIRLLLDGIGAYSAPAERCSSTRDDSPPTSADTELQTPYNLPAKGTGYAFGPLGDMTEVEELRYRRRFAEEAHVWKFLEILCAFIDPQSTLPDDDAAGPGASTVPLPSGFGALLAQSGLMRTLEEYLCNDSVLDVAQHSRLYMQMLRLLRAIAARSGPVTEPLDELITPSLVETLFAMRTRMLASEERLSNQIRSLTLNASSADIVGDDQEEKLMLELQRTCDLVQSATNIAAPNTPKYVRCKSGASVPKSLRTPEQRYIDLMQTLQFDTTDIIAADCSSTTGADVKFVVPYHFESKVRSDASRVGSPARLRRLAQEVTTLTGGGNLPLSYSSTVFVRCDSARLDIMKVLLIGPAGTPYADGCFVFDVYFPADYPEAPLQIHLETTGGGTVRFNPNLYENGGVCLSLLSTTAGRPEELWNSRTSNLLQVLVSIQALILVPDSFFNAPATAILRGTPFGEITSYWTNFQARLDTWKWAMRDHISDSCCPIFGQIIRAHLWLKRAEICRDAQDWLNGMASQPEAVFDAQYREVIARGRAELKQLRKELHKLEQPSIG